MEKRRIGKSLRKVILFTFILFTIFNTKVLAVEVPVVKRLEGKNRVETSIAVSREAFKDKANVAIIVGYDGEVDALTGTLLAQKKGAPILISDKKSLSDGLKNELKRLDSRDIFILGGTNVVSEGIEAELKALGLNVTRIRGERREETAINIANESIDGEVNEAFLSLGYGVYADALAIGPIAATKNAPLLLTKSNDIDPITLDYLKSLNIKKVNIIGGKNAVSDNVKKVLENMGISVVRISGASREETAVSIANIYIKNPNKIFIANGYKYADAVVGGYLAAKENVPILLSASNTLKEINREYIQKNKLDVNILGGKVSISDRVLRDIKIELGIIKEEIPSNIKELKEVIDRELKDINKNITIKYQGNLKMEELTKLIEEAFNDGSYISGVLNSISYTLSNTGSLSSITMDVSYLHTKSQEEYIDIEVDRIIKNIIKPGMSELQKVKTIHDYIIKNSVYSEKTNTSPHSAYTLLKEGKGVCQAYALATYKLLDAAAIDNYYVTGVANDGSGSEPHAWNLVRVDGRYYHMDVTWDDPEVVGGGNVLVYDYFLISQETLYRDHLMDKNSFPKAVDKRYEGKFK